MNLKTTRKKKPKKVTISSSSKLYIFSYDCSSFTGRDTSKCYHKGNVYEPMEKVEDPELETSCTVACRCTRYYPDEPAKITCAHIDCPEFFGSYEPRGSHCISQYEQDKCCKSRDLCGKYFE